ncbi:hyalin-like, partial [Anneissia japonica]|uniref:hyalin-like n=1 Tax=Anneissia japonica TaxID=1529436 RepID=UPI0014255568
MLQCPDDIDIALTNPGQPYSTVYWNISVSDNSGSVTWNCSRVSGDRFDVIWPIERQNVSCEAEDVHGNTAECVFYVTVIDVENPSILCPSNVDVPTDEGSAIAVVSWSVNYSDNTDSIYDLVLSGSNTEYIFDVLGYAFSVGTTTLNYVITDVFGNTDNCSFTITVRDTGKPMLQCPDDIDVALTDPGQPYSTLYWNVSVSDNSGSVTRNCSRVSGDRFDVIWPIERQNVSCEAEDVHGNTAECVFYITVIDEENPSVSCPSSIDVPNDDGSAVAVVSWSVNVTDNTDSIYEVIVSGSGTEYNESGQAFPVGMTTLYYVVTDAFGNTDNCSFTITVRDTGEPMLQCPNDINLALTDPGQPYSTVYWNVSVSDNSGSVTWNCSRVSGDRFDVIWPIERQNVSCEAEDAHGNTAECVFYVTVIDEENPSVSCPRSVGVPNDDGSAVAVVSWSVNVTDNTDSMYEVIVSGSGTEYNETGQAFPVGMTTLDYVVTDAFGNTENCSFTITVQDTREPMLQCPNDIDVALTDPDQPYSTVYWNVSVSDNSGSVTWNCSKISGDRFYVIWPTERQNVSCEAEDAHGNTAECVFYVTVIDKETPSISCPSNIDVSTDDGSAVALVSWLVNVTDNSGSIYEVTVSGSGTEYNKSEHAFPVGITALDYVATDAFGNTDNCSFTVTVRDTGEPMLKCPNDINLALTDPGQPYSTVYWNVSVSDNSGSVTWNCSRVSGDRFDVIWPIERQNVSCEAEDVHGNTAECVFYITVI